MSSQTPVGARPDAHPRLSRREARWVLKRCARRGHVLVRMDDPIGAAFRADGPDGELLRCLRCGLFVPPPRGPAGATAPVPLAEVPHALRGGHGRKLALLRLLAVERGVRGVVLLLIALGIARLAGSRVAVAEWLARLAKAAQPLGQQLGWDVGRSPTLNHTLSLLGHSSAAFVTVAWLVAGYGVLELVEGIGLWGGWLWAEYLTAVATALLIPVEVHELTVHATLLKVGALLVNIAAVIYLIWKGRLFGIRGGHAAYLADVREGTLLADELRAAGRATSALTGHALV